MFIISIFSVINFVVNVVNVVNIINTIVDIIHFAGSVSGIICLFLTMKPRLKDKQD